ncbi:hypothetical protein [Azospirillum sp.]|uniref:hypothetical protein n=1 Tax=Azospirillum sp. TaxID=34012 RepID=UPI002D46E878|nr:hypothetical protein [Azospirillum sp.]HYD65474.1 hypothetical protein [Azospirillum sp.]
MQPTESTSTPAAKPEAAAPARPAFAGAFSGGGASGGLFVDVIRTAEKTDAPATIEKA